ncbi:MAG: hypothetical protein IKR81_03415, partial [Victivallales bacterium]|nr:hypothetical protein [Victivallales bacterium]
MTARQHTAQRKNKRTPPHRWRGVSCCVGALFVTTLVITLTGFLPVRVEKGEDEDRENHSDILPITALAPIHHHSNTSDALDNIYAWVDLKSTRQLDAPDSALLFSAYTGKQPPYAYTQLKQHEVQDTPMFSDKMLGETPPDSLEKQRISNPIPWETQIVMPSPTVIPFTPPKGIFWLNENGQVVINPPAIDTKEAMEALDNHSGLRSTKLEYMTSQMRPPRIVVRQSSGSPKLDTLAVNALRE